MNWTSGWKTYAIAGAVAAVYFLELLGLVPSGTTEQVNAVAAPIFGLTVGHKLVRMALGGS